MEKEIKSLSEKIFDHEGRKGVIDEEDVKESVRLLKEEYETYLNNTARAEAWDLNKSLNKIFGKDLI